MGDKKTFNISLVIPTYNSIEFIARTIHSIIEQPNCNVEIIVVDSGSKDGTVEFCNKYTDKVLYCPPGNMYSAINMGMEAATNDVVAYINSDDYYYENVLYDFLKYFEDNNLDFAYSQGDFVDHNGRFRSSGYTPQESRLLPYFLSGIMPIIQPTIIYKKSLYNAVKGFNDEKYKYCADFDFCYKAITGGFKIGFYDLRTICFRVSNKQITNSFKTKMDDELNSILSNVNRLKGVNKMYVLAKYKYNNALNILLRGFRGKQLNGKFSLSRVISPY